LAKKFPQQFPSLSTRWKEILGICWKIGNIPYIPKYALRCKGLDFPTFDMVT